MASLLDKITTGDKSALVIDLGQVYTKCGFSGTSSPQLIIPTSVLVDEKFESVFENEDRLFKFFQSIFYKFIDTNKLKTKSPHSRNTIDLKNRRVIIIESIITPTRIRHLLAEILFQQFNIPSLLFLPAHLCATYTLARPTVLVLDIGYKEAQILPVCESVLIPMLFDSVHNASQLIHRRIHVLLEEHALITQEGRKKPFKSLNVQLPEDVLENIKIRCCFVSPFHRAQIYAKNKLSSTAEPLREAPTISYPFGAHTLIHIPGSVREFACEVLFQEDIDGKSIVSLVLDTLIRAPIDFRQVLAENILIIGGTAIISGFLHRFNAELMHLMNNSVYANKLRIKKFRFHRPPSELNCAAWLGGSLFGELDQAESQAIKRENYLNDHFLPDWFSK